MRWNLERLKSSSGRAAFSATLFGLLFFFVGAPRAAADDWGKCQRRVEKAEWKLHREIEKHGWYSRQAQRRRYELRDARERCWREYGRWWDGRGRSWRGDRDWDRDWNRDWDHR